jgi:hypothetical protein
LWISPPSTSLLSTGVLGVSRSWQELEAGHASVEPSGSWFVPHLQAHYEELRHSREIEHAYSEAIMEDHRRTRESAEEEQRREDEMRISPPNRGYSACRISQRVAFPLVPANPDPRTQLDGPTDDDEWLDSWG